jgi:DNA-directed RNA polymerase specialized sigma24 family protein
MTDPADLQGEVQRAVAGDSEAVRRLVRLLTPVIQARVARCLLRYQSTARPAARSRNIRQEVEDLTQEIFLLLFAGNGKVLRTWEPDRGLALANFVGLIAERRTASILHSGRRSPWRDEPSPPEDLDRESDGSGPLEAAMSRQQLERLFARLTEELSPLGRHLFDLLFVRELPLLEIVATTGMTADAVYAWRSRLRRLARRLLAAESDGATSRRKTSMGGEQ